VRAYIQIDRLDLAQKELGTMQGIDDDATSTQLATAWLDIALVPLLPSFLPASGVIVMS
jgi:coatomer protein complex subunit epsilon